MGKRRIKPDAMVVGLRETIWPGRLQQLKPGPLAPQGGPPVWIDAAHNPGGAEVLADAIRTRTPDDEDKVVIIVAMQAVKDAGGVMSELVPVAAEIIAIPLPDSGGQEGGPGAEPRHLVSVAETVGGVARMASNLLEATRMAREAGADRVYISGSVYLCGAALAANGEQVT